MSSEQVKALDEPDRKDEAASVAGQASALAPASSSSKKKKNKKKKKKAANAESAAAPVDTGSVGATESTPKAERESEINCPESAVETVEPAKAAVEPVEPAKTAEPVEPVKTAVEPVEPAKAMESVEPMEPAKAVEPVEPVGPAKAMEPVEPVKAAVESVEPAETAAKPISEKLAAESDVKITESATVSHSKPDEKHSATTEPPSEKKQSGSEPARIPTETESQAKISAENISGGATADLGQEPVETAKKPAESIEKPAEPVASPEKLAEIVAPVEKSAEPVETEKRANQKEPGAHADSSSKLEVDTAVPEIAVEPAKNTVGKASSQHNRLPSVLASSANDDFFSSLSAPVANGGPPNGGSTNASQSAMQQAATKHRRDISAFRVDADDDFFSNLSTTVEEEVLATTTSAVPAAEAKAEPAAPMFETKSEPAPEPESQAAAFGDQDDSFFSSLSSKDANAETKLEQPEKPEEPQEQKSEQLETLFADSGDDDFFTQAVKQKESSASAQPVHESTPEPEPAPAPATAPAPAPAPAPAEDNNPFANDDTADDIFGVSSEQPQAEKRAQAPEPQARLEAPTTRERPLSFSFLEEDDDLLPDEELEQSAAAAAAGAGATASAAAVASASSGAGTTATTATTANAGATASQSLASRYTPVQATPAAPAHAPAKPRQSSTGSTGATGFDLPPTLAHAAHRPTLQPAASFSNASPYGMYAPQSGAPGAGTAAGSVYSQGPKPETKASSKPRSFFEDLPMPPKRQLTRKTSQYLDQAPGLSGVPPGGPPGGPPRPQPVGPTNSTPVMPTTAAFQTPQYEYPPPNPYASGPRRSSQPTAGVAPGAASVPPIPAAGRYQTSPGTHSASATPYAPVQPNPYGPPSASGHQVPPRPSTHSPVNPYAPPPAVGGGGGPVGPNTYSPGSARSSAYSPSTLAARYSPASMDAPPNKYGHSRSLSTESNTSVGYGARSRHLANEFGSALPPKTVTAPPPGPGSGPAHAASAPPPTNPYQPGPPVVPATRATPPVGPANQAGVPPPRGLQPANPIVPKKPQTSSFGDLPSDIEGTSRRMQYHTSVPPAPDARAAPRSQNFPASLNLKMEEEQSRPLPPVDNEALLKRQFPLFAWGRGKAVTVIPGTMSFGGSVSGTQVRVTPLPESLTDKTTKTFLGPLVAAKGPAKIKRKDLEKWMDDKIAELERPESSAQPDFVMLWKIVRQLLALETPLAATTHADLAPLRQLLNPALAAVKPSDLDTFAPATDIYQRVQHRRQSSVDSSHSSARFGGEQLQALAGFIELGNREKALRYALENRLWSHALVIASSLGTAEWNDTVSEFVREEIRALDPLPGGVGQSVAFAYRLFAGAGADAISEIKPSGVAALPQANVPHPASHALDKNLDNWLHFVSIAISNRSPQDSAAIFELGKLLRSHGRVAAAHCCMVLSGFPLFGAEDGMVLLGTDTRFSDAGLGMDLDTIMLSEIYEYIVLTNGQDAAGAPPFMRHLLVYKLQHAMILASAGYAAEAQKYAETVVACIKSNAKYGDLADVAEFVAAKVAADGGSSSGGWLSSKLGRSKFDKMWVQSFNKFVAGEDDDAGTAGGATAAEDEGIFKKLAKKSHSEASSVDSSPNYRAPGVAQGHQPIQRVASFHAMGSTRADQPPNLNRTQSHANFGGDLGTYRKQSIPGSRSASPQFSAVVPPRPASTTSSTFYNPYAPGPGGVAAHADAGVGVTSRPSSRGALSRAHTYSPVADYGPGSASASANVSPEASRDGGLHDDELAPTAPSVSAATVPPQARAPPKRAAQPPANPYAPPVANPYAPSASGGASNPYAPGAASSRRASETLGHGEPTSLPGSPEAKTSAKSKAARQGSVPMPAPVAGGQLSYENPYAPVATPDNPYAYGGVSEPAPEGLDESVEEAEPDSQPEPEPEPEGEPQLALEETADYGEREPQYDPEAEYGLEEEEEFDPESRPGNKIFAAPPRRSSAPRSAAAAARAPAGPPGPPGPPAPPMPHFAATAAAAAASRSTPTIPEEETDAETEDLGLGNSKKDAAQEEKMKKEEAEKRAEAEANKKGGWFSWLRKPGSGEDPNKPKPVRAKLGEESSFYFDENLKRWVNKKAPLESQGPAKPPPPPKAKSKPTTPSPAAAPAPVPAPGTSSAPTGRSPATSQRSTPVPGPGAAPGAAPSPASAPAPPGKPPGGPPAPAKPPISGGLDDLLAAAPAPGRKPARRNARSRYVDIVSQQQEQQ